MNSAVALFVCSSALAVLCLVGTAAHALTISPVLVNLSPARRIASIVITNPGDRAVSFQTEILAWSQPDGIDRYADTDELVVVPPIAEIAAGGTQIFRVTLRNPAGAREQAYRLIFEDVTEVVAPSASSDEVSLNVRVNHNLPVFVAAAGKPSAQPRLGPCTSPVPANSGCVRLANDGTRYAQIKSVSVESGSWHKEVTANARVLAGAWRQWTFELPPTLSSSMQVKAETSDGVVTMELPIPAR